MIPAPGRSALVLALALAASCAGASRPQAATAPAPAPDAAPTTDAELTAVADGLFEVLDTLAATVEAHPGDCPAMARDLERLFDRAAPIVARARAIQADPTRARAFDAEMRRRDAASAPLVERASAGLAPCAKDPAVQRAVARMPVL